MTQPSRFTTRFLTVTFALTLATAYLPHPVRAESESQRRREREERERRGAVKVRLANPAPGHRVESQRINALSTTVVNFEDLARKQAAHPNKGPVRALELEAQEMEDPLEPFGTSAPSFEIGPRLAPTMAQVVSPSPSQSYIGLDDIPMQDSLFIIIPPDCGGAVGPTKILQGLNNNYRILDKATGAVLSTVGTATFWAPSGETDLLGLTDPRTLYDPYNNRWIAVMQTISTNNFLLGVSQTSDPSGAWFLYRFSAGTTSVDFPIVGFSKNWIAITINKYSNIGTFTRGLCLAVDYPSARTGTGTGTLFTQAMNTHFCSAPAMTMSATEDTIFVLTHLTAASATYSLDKITGTASAPVYTSGGTLTRPGGAWVNSSGQLLPQSAPNCLQSAKMSR